MKPYYYVNRQGVAALHGQHSTLQDALFESKRLAKKHPGQAFEILAVIGITMSREVNTFWMDGIEFQNLTKTTKPNT
jgi:hypothetical protein